MVEDDRGLWGVAVAVVDVIAGGQGGGSPRPPAPAWHVSAPAQPVARGGYVPIVVHGSSTHPLSLVVPQPFRAQVVIEGHTIDYGALNGQPFSLKGGVATGTLYVPWTQSQPSDGPWTIRVTDGITTEAVQVRVKGTMSIQEATESFAAANS